METLLPPHPSTLPLPVALFVRRLDLEKKYDRPMIGGLHTIASGVDRAEPLDHDRIVRAVGKQLMEYVDRRDFVLSAWWMRPEQAHQRLDLRRLEDAIENGFRVLLCFSPQGDMPWKGEIKALEREHLVYCKTLDKHRVKVFLPPPDGTTPEPNCIADGNSRLAALLNFPR